MNSARAGISILKINPAIKPYDRKSFHGGIMWVKKDFHVASLTHIANTEHGLTKPFLYF